MQLSIELATLGSCRSLYHRTVRVRGMNWSGGYHSFPHAVARQLQRALDGWSLTTPSKCPPDERPYRGHDSGGATEKQNEIQPRRRPVARRLEHAGLQISSEAERSEQERYQQDQLGALRLRSRLSHRGRRLEPSNSEAQLQRIRIRVRAVRAQSIAIL